MRGIGILALVAATATSAFAGLKSYQPIVLHFNSDGSGYIMGSLADTRNTPDSLAYIGCEVWAEPGYVGGRCYGHDATGRSEECTFSGAQLAQAAAMVNGGSRVQVSFDNTNTCTFILVTNTSNWKPSTP